jgi:hypothetical protein
MTLRPMARAASGANERTRITSCADSLSPRTYKGDNPIVTLH